MTKKTKVLKEFSFDNRKFNISSTKEGILIKITDNKIPTVKEVEDYISEKNLIVDSEKFYNWYTNNGWKPSWKVSALGWDNSARRSIECAIREMENN